MSEHYQLPVNAGKSISGITYKRPLSKQYNGDMCEYSKAIRILKKVNEEVENELARLKLETQEQLNDRQNELNAKGEKMEKCRGI